MVKMLKLEREDRTELLHFRVTKEEKAMFSALAKKEKVPLSLLIRTALQFFYEEYTKQNKRNAK